MIYKISKYIIPIKEDDEKTILYNAVSGEVLQLSDELYRNISNGNINENIQNFNDLRQKHFIVPFNQDEFRLLRFNEILANQSTKQTLLSYVIAPTTACNYRCVYCFEGNEHKDVTMDLKVVNGVVDFISNQIKLLNNLEELSITWFGGEPLLCVEKILLLGKKIKEIANEHNLSFNSSIVTNGVFLTKDNVDRLIENCNLKSAQITLDGMVDIYCKMKGARESDFYTVINNIVENYEKISIDVRLNTNKVNKDDIYRLVDYLYSKIKNKDKLKVHMAQLINYTTNGTDNMDFMTYSEYKKESSEFVKYLRDKKILTNTSNLFLPCHKILQCRLASKYSFAIGPNGDLYKCEQHIGDKNKAIGNIFTGLFYNEFYFEQVTGVIDTKCMECNLYPICNHYARCPQLHKSIENINPECPIYNTLVNSVKKLVLENLE